jgi:hypothetical protein
MHTDRTNSLHNYNAGNFQEYTYEREYMECAWNIVYKQIDLVTAFYYPWIVYENSINRQ